MLTFGSVPGNSFEALALFIAAIFLLCCLVILFLLRSARVQDGAGNYRESR